MAMCAIRIIMIQSNVSFIPHICFTYCTHHCFMFCQISKNVGMYKIKIPIHYNMHTNTPNTKHLTAVKSAIKTRYSSLPIPFAAFMLCYTQDDANAEGELSYFLLYPIVTI